MTILSRGARLAMVLAFLLPATALAQNTSVATATALTVGQLPVRMTFDATTPIRYYRVEFHIGQSYCIEMTTATDEYKLVDPWLQLLNHTGGAIGANNDLDGTEPDAYHQSRLCYKANETETYYIEARRAPNETTTQSFDMRVVETTLWAPWFYIAGDYSSFVLLRNTTGTAVDVTITWRNATGAVIGTGETTIAGRGALAVNSRGRVTAGETSGTVEIAHNGSPEAVIGQVTTLSATTGLNFNTIFSQRKPW